MKFEGLVKVTEITQKLAKFEMTLLLGKKKPFKLNFLLYVLES